LGVLETVLRAGVFLAPLFMSVTKDELRRKRGALLYSAGLLIYFLTWIPWLQGRELDHVALLLGPYWAPLLVLGGIAVLCSSRAYFGLSVAFVGVHVWAGLITSGIV
jgi:hypothetical protein